MPLIQGAHNGRAAVTTIAIIDAAQYSEHKTSNESILKGAVPFKALIDTGATSTMISRRVVTRLNLQPVTKLKFSGLGGDTWRNGYLFHIAFYISPPSRNTETSKIQILKNVINGGELTDEYTFDVLLGMDVLTTGDLHIAKDGTFRFKF